VAIIVPMQLNCDNNLDREGNNLVREKMEKLSTIWEKANTTVQEKIQLCHRLAAKAMNRWLVLVLVLVVVFCTPRPKLTPNKLTP
jgi:hypothetical protein